MLDPDQSNHPLVKFGQQAGYGMLLMVVFAGICFCAALMLLGIGSLFNAWHWAVGQL